MYDSDGNFDNNNLSPIVYQAKNKVGDVQCFRAPINANNSFERVQQGVTYLDNNQPIWVNGPASEASA